MNAFNQGHYVKKIPEKEINLNEYFQVIKKRYWIILLAICIITAGGYYYTTSNNVPIYESSTRIIVDSDSEYMKTLMVMIKDPIVMGKVKSELELSRASGAIANQIEVERIEDSQVILISVVDQDPAMAAQIANSTASAFKKEVVHLLDFEDVQLLSEARKSVEPVNGKSEKTLILFFVVGLIAGIGFAYLVDSLDGTIKDEQEVEEILDVPILGNVSNMNKKKLTKNKNLKYATRQYETDRKGDSIDDEETNKGASVETAKSDHVFEQ